MEFKNAGWTGKRRYVEASDLDREEFNYEFHFNSDSNFRLLSLCVGVNDPTNVRMDYSTRNNPVFILPEPLYINSISLKSCQFPFSYPNVTSKDKVGILQPGEGEELQIFDFPEGIFDSQTFSNTWNAIPDLNTLVLTAFQAGRGVSFQPFIPDTIIYLTENIRYFLTLQQSCNKDDLPENSNFTTAIKIIDNAPGIGEVTNPYIKFENEILPVRSVPSYLYLRSSIAEGMSVLAVQGGEGKTSAPKNDILAKIVIDDGAPTPFSLYTYQALSAPTEFNVNKFNGKLVDKFNIYFTTPYSDEPIDFNGFAFNGTLQISGFQRV